MVGFWLWINAFLKYVQKRESGCWEWTGYCTPGGYPRYRSKYAHRLAWSSENGEIPAGHHIDHVCRNRRCVNPEHLCPALPFENPRGPAVRWVGPKIRAARGGGRSGGRDLSARVT